MAKKAAKKLTKEQKAFLVGRDYQRRVDAAALAVAIRKGKLVVKK